MWLWLSVLSALLLGIYDVAKKQALKRNGVYWILLSATALTAIYLSPFLSAGSLQDHLSLMLKAVLVSTSWVSGLIAMQHLPLTTVSTIKASRPMFVVSSPSSCSANGSTCCSGWASESSCSRCS